MRIAVKLLFSTEDKSFTAILIKGSHHRWRNGPEVLGSNKGDARTLMKRQRANSPKGMSQNVHVACHYIPIAQNLLYNSYMPHGRRPLYIGLEVDDGSNAWLAGNMPVEITGARCPLKGIRVGCPWDKETMQIVVALGCPPGTLSIGKWIASTMWRCATCWLRKHNDTIGPIARDTDLLVSVNTVGITNLTVPC